MAKTEELYGRVLCRLDMTKDTGEDELQDIILQVLDEAAKEEYLPLSEKIRISRELFNSFRRLDILQDLLEDEAVTEIMVNGTESIFYEKGGRLYRSDRRFISEERLNDVIQQIAGEANRYVNEASPIADARLPDGSRVNVVLKLVAVNGPILTIRKFPSEGGRQRPDPDDPEVPVGSDHHGPAGTDGKPDPRGGGVHKKTGGCKIQHLRERRDRRGKDHVSQCHVGLHPEG